MRLNERQSSPVNFRRTPALPHPRPFLGPGPFEREGIRKCSDGRPSRDRSDENVISATAWLRSVVFLVVRASTTSGGPEVKTVQSDGLFMSSSTRLAKTFLLSQRLAAESAKLPRSGG